jgi:succinyl-CoA synthetase alpha subunit
MIKNIIKTNEYRDSVFLMSISEKIQEIEGVRNIVIVMATDNNKTFLRDVGLLTLESQQATPNDIIVAIEAEDMKVIEAALDDISNLMSQKLGREARDIMYPSFGTALNALPGANLALISVPGEFAAIEAKKAIMNGLHVFIFSDNVPLSEEVELKKLAQQNEVLVMGPSCGASVINNVSIGLMSKVRTGQIGIVGASGSGIQEIAVLIDRQGFGISHAIGTGSRDLSEEVGAITTIQAIEALEWDDNTEVIVLVSKPPPLNTMNKVLKVVVMCKKKVVINFI